MPVFVSPHTDQFLGVVPPRVTSLSSFFSPCVCSPGIGSSGNSVTPLPGSQLVWDRSAEPF